VVNQILMIIAGYFIGAIPFGVIVSRRFGVDILATGSGNPGATNVWRTVGPKAGAIVFILDMLKGCVPAAFGRVYLHDPTWGLLLGFAAVAGHMLSPFIGFRGGKGIATAFGAGCGSVPAVALSAIAVFFLILAITRYVSLASIIAVGTAVLFGFLYKSGTVIIVALAGLEAFIVYKHRENIRRLLNGTERKFTIRNRNKEESPGNPTDNEKNAGGSTGVGQSVSELAE
jgi:acyl phosphate:glycerol-3-phosphate acyltransferase